MEKDAAIAADPAVTRSQLLLALRAGRPGPLLDAARQQPGLINMKGESDTTPLHWLAFLGNVEGIREALALGAEVNALAANLQTPVMWAAIQGQLGAIELLSAAGADLRAQDSLGATALILAVQHSHYLAMLLLMDLGASPEAPDARGCTPAHWAAYRGNIPALTALQRRRADLTSVDFEGMQPLHRCARLTSVPPDGRVLNRPPPPHRDLQGRPRRLARRGEVPPRRGRRRPARHGAQ